MNQVKTRLQALGLLDRSIGATTDDELTAAIDALDDEHREALDQLARRRRPTPPPIRAVDREGPARRHDGERRARLTDACLADCIKQLGDHADNPTSDQLREVLPGIVERHGVPITRMMLASTVVGEAPASAIIRDLLKHDDAREAAAGPAAADRRRWSRPAEVDPAERAALKAKRKEMKARKQAEARAAREQSARDRKRI